MTDIGEGFGGEYVTPAGVEDTPGRREKVITRLVNGKRVTIRVRDKVAPVDPLVLLTKASLYVKQVPGRFPMPPINRRIKEALIKVAR